MLRSICIFNPRYGALRPVFIYGNKKIVHCSEAEKNIIHQELNIFSSFGNRFHECKTIKSTERMIGCEDKTAFCRNIFSAPRNNFCVEFCQDLMNEIEIAQV